MKTSEYAIPCQACGGSPLVRVEEVRDDGVVIDLYKCQDEQCGRKIAIVFEPSGGYSEEKQNVVLQEIARRGAFFPQDFGRRGLGR